MLLDFFFYFWDTTRDNLLCVCFMRIDKYKIKSSNFDHFVLCLHEPLPTSINAPIEFTPAISSLIVAISYKIMDHKSQVSQFARGCN